MSPEARPSLAQSRNLRTSFTSVSFNIDSNSRWKVNLPQINSTRLAVQETDPEIIRELSDILRHKSYKLHATDEDEIRHTNSLELLCKHWPEISHRLYLDPINSTLSATAFMEVEMGTCVIDFVGITHRSDIVLVEISTNKKYEKLRKYEREFVTYISNGYSNKINIIPLVATYPPAKRETNIPSKLRLRLPKSKSIYAPR